MLRFFRFIEGLQCAGMPSSWMKEFNTLKTFALCWYSEPALPRKGSSAAFVGAEVSWLLQKEAGVKLALLLREEEEVTPCKNRAFDEQMK